MAPKTILIADDDRDLVEALTVRCEQMGLKVLAAYDAMTALTRIREERPDLVCLDVSMPSGSGLSVCEMLTADKELSSLPVIVLTGSEDEDTIRRCHSMCAYYVLKSRDVWQRMKPILCELLGIQQGEPRAAAVPDQAAREQPPPAPPRHDLGRLLRARTLEDLVRRPADTSQQSHPPTLLYVEDDVDESNALKIRLQSRGIDVIQAFNGTEGYRLAVAKEPDVVLCDFVMPEGEGDYLLRRLQENPVTENIPVIFLTGRPGCDLKRRLLAQGARAYLTKPIDTDELLREMSLFLQIDPLPAGSGTMHDDEVEPTG